MAAELVGKAAPDFEIEYLDGSKKKLSEIIAEGKPVVVDFYCNFWPACGPAATEMDKLAADDKYKDKVNFVLVNLEGVPKAEQYKTSKGLSGACPHGAGKPPGEYGIKYIPHKALIGKDGKVIKNYEGFAWTDIDGAM